MRVSVLFVYGVNAIAKPEFPAELLVENPLPGGSKFKVAEFPYNNEKVAKPVKLELEWAYRANELDTVDSSIRFTLTSSNHDGWMLFGLKEQGSTKIVYFEKIHTKSPYQELFFGIFYQKKSRPIKKEQKHEKPNSRFGNLKGT